jgi:hypothetical protein
VLRRLVFALGLCLLLAGWLVLARVGHAGGWWLVVNGLAIMLGLMFERVRYKRELNAPPAGPGWELTNERSVDESSVVSVWFNAASGQRAYVRTPGEQRKTVLF